VIFATSPSCMPYTCPNLANLCDLICLTVFFFA
jgi:hypothetical protein